MKDCSVVHGRVTAPHLAVVQEDTYGGKCEGERFQIYTHDGAGFDCSEQAKHNVERGTTASLPLYTKEDNGLFYYAGVESEFKYTSSPPF